jgi:hypothetical protein
MIRQYEIADLISYLITNILYPTCVTAGLTSIVRRSSHACGITCCETVLSRSQTGLPSPMLTPALLGDLMNGKTEKDQESCLRTDISLGVVWAGAHFAFLVTCAAVHHES